MHRSRPDPLSSGPSYSSSSAGPQGARQTTVTARAALARVALAFERPDHAALVEGILTQVLRRVVDGLPATEEADDGAASVPLAELRACLKLSGSEHALEAHAGHEQGGEDGHVPRGLVAHLVVDAQAAVALQATERLLDLPAPRLDDEAPAAVGADEFLDDAVAGEEFAAALG